MNKKLLLTDKDVFNEIIYLILISLYIFVGIANNSLLIGDMRAMDPNIFYNIKIYVFPAILLFFYITGKKHEIKELIIGLIIFAVFMFSSIASKSYYQAALGGFIICAAAYVKNPKLLTKVMSISLFMISMVVCLSSLTGFRRNLSYDHYMNGIVKPGYYFGFYYYTFLPTILLFCWIMFTYSRRKKASWVELLFVFLVSHILYQYSTHRLGYYLSIIVLFMYVIFVKLELIKINNKFMKAMALIGFPVSAVVSLLASYIYSPDSKFIQKIDSLLNGRIYLGKVTFDRFNIKLFGQEIVFHNNEYYIIDCGFIFILFMYGLLVFAIVMAMYTFLHHYSCKENETMLFVWITAQMIYTVINNVWLEVESGTCLLVAAVVIKQEYEKRKKLNENMQFKKSDL